VCAGRSGIHVSNDDIERTIMAALCAGINAGGDSRAVEFISTKDVATVNTSMKLR
jgi:hypothetical protein